MNGYAFASALASRWLPDRCVILRRVVGQRDEYGGLPAEQYLPATEYGQPPEHLVPCYYETAVLSPQESVVQGRVHFAIETEDEDGRLVPVVIGDQDRIGLVERFERRLPSRLEFAVTGPAEPLATEVVVPVNAVTRGGG